MEYTTETDRRVGEWYGESHKEEFVFCAGCTMHVHEDDIRQNNGFCPGCQHLEESTSGIRGL